MPQNHLVNHSKTKIVFAEFVADTHKRHEINNKTVILQKVVKSSFSLSDGAAYIPLNEWAGIENENSFRYNNLNMGLNSSFLVIFNTDKIASYKLQARGPQTVCQLMQSI